MPPLRFGLDIARPRTVETGPDRRPALKIDRENLGQSFMWYCTSCTERRADVATNETALRHIEAYPTHVVVGFGSTVYKFSAVTYHGWPVDDIPLPGESLE